MRQLALLISALLTLTACIPNPTEVPFEAEDLSEAADMAPSDVPDMLPDLPDLSDLPDSGAADIVEDTTVDPCLSCDENASCVDDICTCDSGFEGDGQQCADVDECALDLDDCGLGADCTNFAGSFECACRSGFVGDGRTCVIENSIATSVQHVVLDLTDASSASEPLPRSTTNAVPFATKRLAGSTGSAADYAVDVFIGAGGNTVEAQRVGDTGGLVVEVAVVEFDPTKVRVESGLFSFPVGEDQITVDLARPVVDLTRAFFVFSHRAEESSEGALASFLSGQFASTSSLDLRRKEADSQVDGHWYVVEALADEFLVEHRDVGDLTDLTKSASIDPVDLGRTLLFYSFYAEGPGPGGNGVDCSLDAADSVRCSRMVAGGTIKSLRAQIVQLSGVRVESTDVSLGATIDASFDPGVDPARSFAFGGAIGMLGLGTIDSDSRDGSFATARVNADGVTVNATRGVDEGAYTKHLWVLQL